MARWSTPGTTVGPRWLAALLAMLACDSARLSAQDSLSPGPVPADIQVSQPPPGLLPAEEQVVEVRVVGNKRVPIEKILPKVRTRSGRPCDAEQIERDVRELNRTGWFFNIKASTQQVPGGRIVYFEVVERPILQYVKYVGAKKVKTRHLEKETGLKTGDALDPFAVEEARAKIEDFYQRKGFSKVTVTLLEGDKAGDRGAIFLINEGQKQRILWTYFEGNTIADDSRLRTQIQSKPGILWIFKGEVDRKQIDEDVNRLTAYYRSLGFFRARVGRELEFNDNGDWLHLTFVIDEGPRYKVRNVSFLGNTKFGTEDLGENAKLKSGQFFNQAHMTSDVAGIQEKYGSIGYVFADVKPENRFLDEPGQLDLVYKISEGDRYRVGEINVQIRGEYPHTRITTVLNRLSLHPGDIVDIRKIRDSERRLRASGLFLVDQARGVSPKIVFSPPGMDDDKETEVAQRPRPTRSPGRMPGGNGGPVAPTGYGGLGGSSIRGQSPDPPDRTLGLTLHGEWIGPKDELYPHAPPPHAFPDQSPAWGQPPAAPVQTQPMVVRGQYTPEVGSYVPRLPWPNRQTTTSSTNVPVPTYSSTGTAPYGAPAVTSKSSGLNWVPPNTATPVSQPWPANPPATSSGQVVPNQGNQPAPVYGQPSANPSSQPAPFYGQPPANPGNQPAPVYGRAPATQQPWVYQPSPGPQPVPVQPAPPYAQAPSGPLPPSPGGAPWRPPRPPANDGLFSPDSPYISGPEDEAYTRPLDLRVLADETQTGRLMFGVGVNSDAGLIGSLVIDEQNFDWTRFPRSFEDIRNATAWRGAGQRFRMEAVPGTQVQRYLISFQEPYLLDTAVGLGLSGFYYDRRFTEWDEQRLGGRVSLGYQFTHDLSGNVAFRGSEVKIRNPIVPTPPELTEVLGSNSLYGFQVQLAHDTRDNTFLPTEGHFFEASFEQVIGSFQYPRVELDLRQYFLLRERPDGSGRHVLSLAGRMAVTGDNTPIYEHYFAGGFSTIRGFDFRGASPRDPLGVTVGGEFMLLASAEYLFPITADDMLRGVIFLDTGTVEPTISNWSNRYRVAPGFGLRIVVPAMGPAPIALDFAFPISREPGDRSEVFSFFVGFGR